MNIIKEKILETIVRRGIKDKTIVILITGASGSGKSMLMLKLAYELERKASEILEKEFEFNINNQFIFSPLHYSQKIENWLKSNYFCLGIDEMRFLVSSKTWQTLINRSIADANATIRQIKEKNCNFCGILLYNTQFVNDIDKDVRRTIDYLIHCKVYNNGNRAIKIYEYKYNIFNDRFYLKNFELNFDNIMLTFNEIRASLLDNCELRKMFLEEMVETKSKILKKRLETILREVKGELGEINFNEILNNNETFELIKNMASYSKRRGIFFSTEKREIIMKMFNLTKKEYKKFEEEFKNKCKEVGLI